MGIVLKAYEESLDRYVAVKIIRPDLARDEVAIRRFTQEAKAAAALQHASIITIHGVGEDSGTHYIAMELVSGPSLAQLIHEHGPLSTELVREIFGQLLSGLAAAHDAGLIHRDIKSSNILLKGEDVCPANGGRHVPGHPPRNETVGSPGSSEVLAGESPQVRITDFGLARFMSGQTRLTVPGSSFGTPRYMSPEQARGDDDIDHRTDLYSAGVVLYEMLTGRTPFKADAPSAVIHQILHTEPADPRVINTSADARLAQITLWLLAKEASERPANARRVVTALAGGRIPVSRRRRRRAAWYAASAAAVLALAGLALWLIPQLVRPHESGVQSVMPSERITDIQVDEHDNRRINVRRGDDADWQKFTEVSAQINAAEYLDIDSRGGQIVVAGCEKQLDDEGSVLAAFDSSANKLWQIPLHSTIQWPDCGLPRSWWHVLFIAKGEINGIDGEDLIVVAADEDCYACRISVIDPLSGSIGSTFWHFGGVPWVRVVDDFFEDGRSAIFAKVFNNKLDGFDGGVRDGETQFTRLDIVLAAMILDPATMEGLGPPLTNRISGMLPAKPWAYAFLNLPYSLEQLEARRQRALSGQDVLDGVPDSIVSFDDMIDDANLSFPEREDPSYILYTSARTPEGKPRSVGNPVLDRNLDVFYVASIKSTSRFTQEQALAFWKRHWRPLFQEGRYVGNRLGAQSGDE